MPDTRDVILKHSAAVNDRDRDADPWAADAELVAPGGRASGRDGVIAFLGEHLFFDQMDFLGQLGSSPVSETGRHICSAA